MTLTKADLVLTQSEGFDAYNSGEEPGFGLAIDRVSSAAAAKAVYALVDELRRQIDLAFEQNTAWTSVVLLGDALNRQLEAAGLPRPGKSG